MRVLNLLKLSKGELYTLTEGGSLLDAGYTPSEEPSLYSIYRGRLVKKDENLGGFFVDFGDFEGFLPFSKTSEGRKVGDILTLQVSREALEGKPPRFTEFLTIPVGNCFAILDGRGRVSAPKGLKIPFSELKEFARRLGVSLLVGGECDLSAVEKLVERIKKFRAERGIGLLFKWKSHYTRLLAGGVERLLSDHPATAEDTLRFIEEIKEPPSAGLGGTFEVVKSALITRLVETVFSHRFGFEGGNLILRKFEGFVGVDLNGFGNRLELNLKGFEKLLEILRISKLGGLVAVDLITPSGRAESGLLREKLRGLILKKAPFCKLLGFTNGGLTEILCPYGYKPLLYSLGVENPYCPSEFVPSDEILTLSVLERIPDPSGDYRIKLHPFRETVPGKLRKFLYGKVETEWDWRIKPSEFFVESL